MLVLFAVMLTNRITEITVSNASLGLWGGLMLFVAVAPVLLAVALVTPWETITPAAAAYTTETIGDSLLTRWLLPFEVASHGAAGHPGRRHRHRSQGDQGRLTPRVGPTFRPRAALEPTMQISLSHFLIVGALLFCFGLVTVTTRRNAVGVLMGVELILNGANINFAAFNHYVVGGVSGQVFALFVIVLAAAEAAVGLAIVLAVFQTFKTIDVRYADLMRE